VEDMRAEEFLISAVSLEGAIYGAVK
jgi:hypothetical protein